MAKRDNYSFSESNELSSEYSHEVSTEALRRCDTLAMFGMALGIASFILIACLLALVFEGFGQDALWKTMGLAAFYSALILMPGFAIGRISGTGSGWHEIALIFRNRGVLYKSARDIDPTIHRG